MKIVRALWVLAAVANGCNVAPSAHGYESAHALSGVEGEWSYVTADVGSAGAVFDRGHVRVDASRVGLTVIMSIGSGSPDARPDLRVIWHEREGGAYYLWRFSASGSTGYVLRGDWSEAGRSLWFEGFRPSVVDGGEWLLISELRMESAGRLVITDGAINLVETDVVGAENVSSYVRGVVERWRHDEAWLNNAEEDGLTLTRTTMTR